MLMCKGLRNFIGVILSEAKDLGNEEFLFADSSLRSE
jgi:hypothetical protein